MAQIDSEDDNTFVIRRPDGTLSDPISKDGAPELYQTLKTSADPGSGAAIDNVVATGGGAWDPVGAPPATPPAQVGPPSLLAPPKVILPGSVFAAPGQTRPLTPMQIATGDMGASGASGSWDGAPASTPDASAGGGTVVAPDKMAGAGGNGLTTMDMTKTTSHQLDSKYVDALHRSMTAAGEATAARMQQQAADEQTVADHKQLQAMAMSKQRQQLEDHQNEINRRIDSKMKDVQAVQDDFLNSKVDPDHIWGDEGTGSRIGAAVGIALGAIGAGMTGSKENLALNIVQSAIQRDIEAQKANIEKKGKGVQFAQTGLELLTKKLGDQQAAEIAMMNMGMAMYDKQLEAIENSNKSKETLSAVQEARANVQADIAKNDAALNTRLQEVETKAVEPKHDPENPKVSEEIMASEELAHHLKAMRDFAQATDFNGVGPVGSKLQKLRSWIPGLSANPDATEIRQRAQEVLVKQIHALAGAHPGEGIAKRLEDINASVGDKPADFMRKANVLINEQEADAKAKRDALTEGGYHQPAALRYANPYTFAPYPGQ